MCDPDCCPPSFDLHQFIDICTDTSDDASPPPAKRAKVGPKVFVHVSQDVPDWADMYDEVIRYNKQQDPALKRKQKGDLRVTKDGRKQSFDGRFWRARCAAAGCNTCPKFGPPGKHAIHCVSHRLEDEIDVRNRRCAAVGCHTRANYGPPGKRAVHCLSHRLDGEINVHSRRCAVLGCLTQPSYGLIGERAIHCAVHRLDGEINVCNPMCDADGCPNHASFAQPGHRAKHCS